MRGLIIGTGAAGNKAAIELLERNYISKEDLLLINSTMRDIPQEYRGYACVLSDEQEGCGKERSIAKEITLKALQTGKADIRKFILPEHKKVIVITSVEGGTGSGSSPIIAKYCKQVLGMPVEIIGFKGFEDDTRGLQNTVEWFQELSPEYGIQTICNSRFLKQANGNRLRAEKLANEELCKRVSLSLGLVIKESAQNIDPADIFKISNTTGYTDIQYIPVDDKIKSIEQFNAIVKVGLDETKSLEVEEPNAKRLGIILNLQRSSQEFIDFTFSVIKERYGSHVYEVFQHVQYDEAQEEFIGIIVSGMKLPIEEVKHVYDKYVRESSALSSDDDFFSEISGLVGNRKDNEFNMLRRSENTITEDAFFNGFYTDKKKPQVNNKKNDGSDY